jgi:ParB-like nuclease domain
MLDAEMKWVPTEFVEEPLHLLRTVDREAEKYKGLHASMSKDGFWPSRPIEVTEDKNATDGTVTYIISSEGMHRLTVARDLRMKEVPVVILNRPLTEQERLERTVVAEATHTAAKLGDFSRALGKLLEHSEYQRLTNTDLAKRLHQNTDWINKAKKITSLPDSVLKLVDDGKIVVANAVLLVGLQKAGVVIDEKVLSLAQKEQVQNFRASVEALITEQRKLPKVRKVPSPKIRSAPDVCAELDRARKDKTVPAAYVKALAWALRQDSVSATVEGVQPVLSGAEKDAAELRADAAKMEAQLDLAVQEIEKQKQIILDADQQIEKLNREVDTANSVIEALKKGRS